LARLPALHRALLIGLLFDHPLSRALAVPAHVQARSVATLVTVSRWFLPSRATHEMDCPTAGMSAAPTGVITDMPMIVEALIGRIDELQVRVWPSSALKVTVEPMRTTSVGTAEASDHLGALHLVQQLLRHGGLTLQRGIGQIRQPLVVGGAEQ